MPTTASGIVYPSSTDHVRVWEHMQTLAESVETNLAALGTVTEFTPNFSGGISLFGSVAYREGWYYQIGDMVHWGFRMEFGSTGVPTFTSTVVLDLPVPAYVGTAGSSQLGFSLGSWSFRDDSVVLLYSGTIQNWSATGLSCAFAGAWDGTAPRSRINNGIPFAVGNSDILSGQGSYRAA